MRIFLKLAPETVGLLRKIMGGIWECAVSAIARLDEMCSTTFLHGARVVVVKEGCCWFDGEITAQFI